MRRLLRLAAVLLGTLLAARCAAAPTDVDPAFAPAINGAVWCVAVQPDGRIVLGGDFTQVQGVPHAHLARLWPDGSLDASFVSEASARVRALALLPDGRMIVGGDFITIGGTDRRYLARLGTDGGVDPLFAPQPDHPVHTVAVLPDGRLAVGGEFISIAAGVSQRVALLQANGARAPGFSANANNDVHALAFVPGDRLLAGGRFGQIYSTPRLGVARLLLVGAGPDQAFQASLAGQPIPEVFSVAALPGGGSVIGGIFATVRGVARPWLARLDSDGAPDPAFQAAIDAPVLGVLAQADGKVVACGAFGLVPQPLPSQAGRFRADGSLDVRYPLVRGAGIPVVHTIAPQADGRLLVAGNFTTLGASARMHLGRLQGEPLPQEIVVPSRHAVRWLRGGAAPETHDVAFEYSPDGGSTWGPLGPAARIVGGWEITGMPELPAQARVRARARIAVGLGNASSYLLEQQTGDFAFGFPLTEWKLAELGNAAAFDLADADGDGLVNLAEYGLVLPPNAPNPAPAVERATYPKGERLRVIFQRHAARSDVTVEVQAADSVSGPWTTIAASVAGGVTTGPGYVGGDSPGGGVKTVEVRDVVNVADAHGRFLRLRVTSATPAAPIVRARR